jgi:hypothetical protein
MPVLSPLPHPPVFLVSETGTLDRFIFSVSSTTQSGIAGGKRVILSLLAGGSWRCKSCVGRPKCHHVDLCRKYAIDAGILDDDGTLVSDLVSDLPIDDPSPVPSSVKQPVSFLPIPPPRWCRLPSDSLDYPSPPCYDSLPAYFPLDFLSRCSCGLLKPPGITTGVWRQYTIFGLRSAVRSTIEVADCLSCSHSRRQFGPDCGTVGVFNWNNTFGFTHEVLNEYTSLFTCTQTPFSSFVTSRHRAYIESSSPVTFCSTETFTRVWFAFTRLQALESQKECPICGKHPELVIADGVSIGYSSSKFAVGLLPPSAVTENSPTNFSVTSSSADSRKAIRDRKARKEIQALVATKSPPQRFTPTSNLPPPVSSVVSLYLPLAGKLLGTAIRELLAQVCSFR